MIRVMLPYHLRRHAGVEGEIALAVPEPVTQRTILDALEFKHPELRGTIRDHTTQRRSSRPTRRCLKRLRRAHNRF